MKQTKTVQIPQELFLELCKYHLLDVQTQETIERINQGLTNKVDQMARRTAYTAYKTTHDPDEKEKARLEYLKRIGLYEDQE